MNQPTSCDEHPLDSMVKSVDLSKHVEIYEWLATHQHIDNLRARNVWPYNQSETVVVMDSVRRGLAQAARGELVYRGSFAEYADDEVVVMADKRVTEAGGD